MAGMRTMGCDGLGYDDAEKMRSPEVQHLIDLDAMQVCVH